MDRVLIVFYSFTGNSRQLAKLLAAQQGWPVGEIVERHARAGISGFIRCAADSLMHLQPAVDYRGPELADFDTVVLVAPVWLAQLAGPMRSFVASQRTQLHRVALYLTMGSRGSSNAVAEVASLLGRDPVLASVATAREVEDGSCAAALEMFGRSLLLPAGAPPARPAMLSPEAG